MADRALVAAGMLLALTLSALPLLLPLDLAGADPKPALSQVTILPPILHLRVVNLSVPQPHSHTVGAGENLWEISRDTGVSVEALAAANGLAPGAILHPGQVLTVPSAAGPAAVPPAAVPSPKAETVASRTVALPTAATRTVTPSTPATPTAATHKVGSGETLWGISRDAGLSVEALAGANRLTPGAILHPGQVLTVPPATGPAAAAPSSKAETSATHAVGAGETLWGISRDAGLSVEALASANHISPDDLLHNGQVLVIPSRDAAARLRTSPSRGHAGPAAPALPVRVRLPEADMEQLLQPTEGPITSRFGWRIHPIFGTREFHTGVDIANRLGTPVLAAQSGVVRFTGWMVGYGRLVRVDHGNGLETAYAHLSAILVASGDRVSRGQILGRVGSTGWSTGPHLFFEVRRGGVALDPAPFFRGAGGSPAAPASANAPGAPAAPSATANASGGPAAPSANANSPEHRGDTALPTPTTAPVR
jgi:murein DD-endopeptidase MepM/ murein hydrolase activator NlpD